MIWIQQNYQSLVAIAGALWTILSIINGMIKNPEAKSILGTIVDALSYIARHEAEGSVKMPFRLSRAPGAAPLSTTVSAFLPFLLIPALLLSSCGLPSLKECNTPTPAIQKKCDFEHGLISCGVTDASQILQLGAEVIAAVAANAFDPGQLVATLEADGIQDVPCVVSKFIAYLSGTAAAEHLKEAHSIALARRAAKAHK